MTDLSAPAPFFPAAVARPGPAAKSVHPVFEYELLVMFARSELTAALAIPMLAVVVAIALMAWAPVAHLLLWLAVLFISKGVLVALCRRFVTQPRSAVDVDEWRSRLAAAEFFYGVTWASVVMVDIQAGPNLEAAHFFIFAALMCVIAMRMMFASTLLPILYAGTIPITVALALRFLLVGHPFYIAMAAVAVAVHIYLIYLASGHNRTMRDMLAFRAEKDALIAELEQAKAISDEARSRAEAANIAKSQFLAQMSHELRTPLNAILGFSEMMHTEVLGPLENEMYRDYARDIHGSGTHLLTLIDDILDLSRIEAGRYELHEAPVDLAGVTRDCLHLLDLRLRTKTLTVAERIDDGMPRLWADNRATRQMCLNLLSNAIKFTPAGGEIIVTVETTQDGHQRFAVRDTGPGIPREEIPRVMSSFGQGSLARQVGESGAGLGLPIVKGLIELHGGRLALRSTVDIGTEAAVTFPASRVMQPVAAAGNSDEPHRPAPLAPRLAKAPTRLAG